MTTPDESELLELHHAFWASGIRVLAGGDTLTELRPVGLKVADLEATEGWRFLSELVARRKAELLAKFTRSLALEHHAYIALAADVRALEQLEQFPAVVRRVVAEAQERAERAAQAQAGGTGGEDGRS